MYTTSRKYFKQAEYPTIKMFTCNYWRMDFCSFLCLRSLKEVTPSYIAKPH